MSAVSGAIGNEISYTLNASKGAAGSILGGIPKTDQTQQTTSTASSASGGKDKLSDEAKKAKEEIEKARDQFEKLIELQNKSGEALRNSVEDQRLFNDLIASGLDESKASEQVKFERQIKDIQGDRADALKDLASIEKLSLTDRQAGEDLINTEYDQQIKNLHEMNRLKGQGNDLLDDRNKKQAQITAQMEMEKQLYLDLANTFAGTFSSAIDAAVDSTKNFGDALVELGAQLLETIGNMLIMYGIGQALGVLGGGDDKGILSFLAMGFGYKPPAAQGAYMSGGFEAFADGGMVSSPTMGLIGEGGSDEYVIPSNKMDSAMARWSAGSRGDAVVNGAEPTGGNGGVALAEAPTNITIEGGVLNFNDNQYIRQDQVPSIVKQASAAGEAQALRKLQMSTATRKRLGL